MHKLVLLRHGESQWNQENRFTGWVDVPLSEKGVEEARAAAQTIAAEGLAFDVAFTSVLKRAIKTLWIVLENLDAMWIPVVQDYRANERMYGALQGLDKAETVRKHGEAQVKIWRRSYDIPPPAMSPDDPRWPGKERQEQTACDGNVTVHGSDGLRGPTVRQRHRTAAARRRQIIRRNRVGKTTDGPCIASLERARRA